MFWKPADRFRLFSLLQLNQYWTTHASHQQHIYRYLKGANLSAWIWIPSIKSYAAEKKVNIGCVLRHHLQYSSYTLFTTICMDAFEWAVVSTVNVTALFTVFFFRLFVCCCYCVEPNFWFSLQFESNRIESFFFEKNSEKNNIEMIDVCRHHLFVHLTRYWFISYKYTICNLKRTKKIHFEWMEFRLSFS